MTTQVDIEALRQDVASRLERARRLAGETPVLVAYDANGIQEFLTRSSNLSVMRGASARIKNFDERFLTGETDLQASSLFNGGGRGMFLVAAHHEEILMDRLRRMYREETGGGSIGVASVPMAHVGGDETTTDAGPPGPGQRGSGAH